MRALARLGLLLFCGTFAPAADALVWPDVPERLERRLSSTDPTARARAARELATLGVARATPLVLRALDDPDVDVRLAAAQVAVRLRVPATDAVASWLGERDARLRAAACDVAQAAPDPRAVQPLARALADVDQHVRTACVEALGASGSPEAVAPLSGKLDDSAPNVRARVARALGKLGDPRAVVPLVGKAQDSVPEVREAVVRALGDLGDARATQALLLAVRDDVPEVRVEALAALGRLRAEEATSTIAPLSLERNAAVRGAALAALGRIGSPAAVRALVDALGAHDDASAGLGRSAVRDALVTAGDAAAPELTALLARAASPAALASAAIVLGDLRAKASAPAIVSALRKGALPPPAALRALAGAGTGREVPVVLEFVSDASAATRAEARGAAEALLDPAHPDGRAVEPLAAALKSPRIGPDERAAFATLLGRTGAPRAATELVALLGATDDQLRLAAIDALGALGGASSPPGAGAALGAHDAADEALVPLLSDDDARVRLHASVALAASGGPAAKRALLAKLDGGGELDRFALFSALGGVLSRHPDEGSSARLFAELPIAAGAERDAVLEAAGRAPISSVVAALREAAKSSSVDDRRSVASVLAAHAGSREAIAIARSLTEDADGTVRAEAAFALGAIGDASVLPALAALAKSRDAAVATNALGAMARVARRAPSSAVAEAACPALTDARATVRANALAALAAARSRCGDGGKERALLSDDASDLVRAAAARALASRPGDADARALDRCAAGDRSGEVASACRPRASTTAERAAGTRPVTVFIFGDGPPRTPKPRAGFVLEYGDGVLRAGTADRRGALFDPAAPFGEVVLRRP